jgi:DNA polymerase-4
MFFSSHEFTRETNSFDNHTYVWYLKIMLRWLFLDLNSYFASVEQQLNPRLRNRPVAVVPMLAESTCAIAASYEAKKFGIKTGTIVRDARRMCPGIIFVPANHNHYIDYHHRVMTVVESCLPIQQIMSIDEVACELTGSQREESNAVRIAHEIKFKLQHQVGECITASIGIAPGRLLAKVASDMMKPNGLTLLHSNDLPHRLYSLQLRDFPGIGYSMERRLHRAGIFSAEQLLNESKASLRQIWGGVNGEHFYHWLRGEDTDTSRTEHQSISHSHVLPPELRTYEGVTTVSQKLLHKAAYRLRKIKHFCRHLGVHVRFQDQTRFSFESRLNEYQDNFSLLHALEELWAPLREKQHTSPHFFKNNPPIKVSIWLSDLIPEEQHHLSFFENPKAMQVSQSLDLINAKFGKQSLFFGGVKEALDSAPNRIAFTNIPDLDAD